MKVLSYVHDPLVKNNYLRRTAAKEIRFRIRKRHDVIRIMVDIFVFLLMVKNKVIKFL
jgi:hypothetical protein